MSALETPICDFGWPAPEFSLADPEQKIWSLEDCRGSRATLVMFLSNHCPFVKAALPRLIRDLERLKSEGVSAVGIMSNNVEKFTADRPEEMQRLSEAMNFPFPYLFDEAQQVASDYGAVCTPDFFGFNQDLELQYRGRLDAGRTEEPPADSPRELFDAMLQIARTGLGPKQQTPSVGCSIKWKT
jgi:peroxiredoxin